MVAIPVGFASRDLDLVVGLCEESSVKSVSAESNDTGSFRRKVSAEKTQGFLSSFAMARRYQRQQYRRAAAG